LFLHIRLHKQIKYIAQTKKQNQGGKEMLKDTMKRGLATFIALVMALSVNVPVFAATATEQVSAVPVLNSLKVYDSTHKGTIPGLYGNSIDFGFQSDEFDGYRIVVDEDITGVLFEWEAADGLTVTVRGSNTHHDLRDGVDRDVHLDHEWVKQTHNRFYHTDNTATVVTLDSGIAGVMWVPPSVVLNGHKGVSGLSPGPQRFFYRYHEPYTVNCASMAWHGGDQDNPLCLACYGFYFDQHNHEYNNVSRIGAVPPIAPNVLDRETTATITVSDGSISNTYTVTIERRQGEYDLFKAHDLPTPYRDGQPMYGYDWDDGYFYLEGSNLQDGIFVPFAIYVPKDLKPDEKLPLVYALHSELEGQSSLGMLLRASQIGTSWAKDSESNPNKRAIVVVPKSDRVINARRQPNGAWADNNLNLTPTGRGALSMLNELLAGELEVATHGIAPSFAPANPFGNIVQGRQQLIRQGVQDIGRTSLRHLGNHIDPNRVYITGHKEGSVGVQAMLMAAPDTFAAAHMVCGDISPSFIDQIDSVKHIPMRYSYAEDWENDESKRGTLPTPTSISRAGQVSKMQAAMPTGNFTATIYPSLMFFHPNPSQITTAVYADPVMRQWMFDQVRGQEGGPDCTLGHDYTVATVDATCLANGSITTSCLRCDHRDVETLPALGHDLSTVTTDAKCEVDGNITTTCSRCDHKDVTPIPALDCKFNESWSVATPATCEETGEAERFCDNGCGKKETSPIPVLNHDMTAPPVVIPAKCEVAGSSTVTCARQNCDHNVVTAIPARIHDMTAPPVVIDAICEVDGSSTVTCAHQDCDHNVVTTIPALVCIRKIVTDREATCEVDGLLLAVCEICDKELEKVVRPATGQCEWGPPVTVNPTCEMPGSITRICGTCNARDVEVLPALGHNHTVVTVDATCLADGSKTTTCSRCEYKNVEILDALGHNHTVVTVDATCLADGSKTTTCSRCEYKNVEVLEKLGHDYTVVTVNAPCGEPGSITTTCSRCDFRDIEILDALVCNFKESWSVATAATCEETGEMERFCDNGCGKRETSIIPVLNHNMSADPVFIYPKCEVDGSSTVTCLRQGCDHNVVTILPALVHNMSADPVFIYPKCEVDGSSTVTCAIQGCDHNVVTILPALVHNMGADPVFIYPKCEVDGSSTVTCAIQGCDHNVVTTIPALGHAYIVDTTDATCEVDGSITTTCAIQGCDHNVVTTIPALGHDDIVDTTDATCEVDGSKTTTCSRCDYKNVDVLPALGHDDIVDTVKATCEDDGSKTTTCSRCDYEKIEVLDALGCDPQKVLVAPTCKKDGESGERCSRCGSGDVEVLDALGCDPQEVFTAPTCKKDGEFGKRCLRCGDGDVEVLPAEPCGEETCVDCNPPVNHNPDPSPSNNRRPRRGDAPGIDFTATARILATPIPLAAIPVITTWLEQTPESTPAGVRTRNAGMFGVRASSWAALAGQRYSHDTLNGNNVQVRIFISDPALFTKDAMLSAWVQGAAVNKTTAVFERWFANKICVVAFDQQDDWEHPIQAAAKVDLDDMNVENLVFYSYNQETNSFKRIATPEYRIDANGYLHFTTPFAGSIVISEGTLERKQ